MAIAEFADETEMVGKRSDDAGEAAESFRVQWLAEHSWSLAAEA